MNCESPTILRPGTGDMMEVPCNTCLPCRIRKKEQWLARIVMESKMHLDNIFVTLTYDEENVPQAQDGMSLYRKDLTDFLKRLRKKIGKFRFYAVGEYGTKTHRPHYHLVLFGLDVSQEQNIDKAWQKGFVQVGMFTTGSARYVAGYVVKKLTGTKEKKKWEEANKKQPEFHTMSQGLGKDYARKIMAKTMNAYEISRDDWRGFIRIEGKKYIVDEFIKNQIIDALETPSKYTDEQRKTRASMRTMIKGCGDEYFLEKVKREAAGKIARHKVKKARIKETF